MIVSCLSRTHACIASFSAGAEWALYLVGVPTIAVISLDASIPLEQLELGCAFPKNSPGIPQEFLRDSLFWLFRFGERGFLLAGNP